MSAAQGVFDFGADTASSTHVVLPDMSLACRADLLQSLTCGDHLRFGRPARRAEVTCDCCRAVGPAYAATAIMRLQGSPANGI